MIYNTKKNQSRQLNAKRFCTRLWFRVSTGEDIPIPKYLAGMSLFYVQTEPDCRFLNHLEEPPNKPYHYGTVYSASRFVAHVPVDQAWESLQNPKNAEDLNHSW